MRRALILIFCVAAALSFGSMLSAQPPNDICETATGPLAVPSLTPGSTIGATPEVLPLCGTTDGTGGAVWYTVIGTGNTMTASTCENSSPGSANYDTKIRIWCDDCDNLNCVAGNDDEPGCNFHSTIAWPSTQGVIYRLLMHGFGGAEGDFELSIADDGVPATGQVPCPIPVATGACCLDDASCVPDQTADECAALGGAYAGDDVSCDEANCTPVPATPGPWLVLLALALALTTGWTIWRRRRSTGGSSLALLLVGALLLAPAAALAMDVQVDSGETYSITKTEVPEQRYDIHDSGRTFVGYLKPIDRGRQEVYGPNDAYLGTAESLTEAVQVLHDNR